MEKFAPILTFLSAFLITYFSVPAIIRLSQAKNLFDEPDGRKVHSQQISSLGGIAIFGGLLISFIFFSAHLANPALNSILVALFIIFITGVKDDLFPLVPYKKFLGQFLAIGILIFQGGILLSSFYGLFGIWELPYWISVVITFIFFLSIINSFNFIDGINGLSSGIGIVVSLTFSFWFYYLNEPLFLILSLSIAGSQLAFWRYNLVKAKIFMGDSGSLILGFFAALLSIYFLQANQENEHKYLLHIDALVFAISVLIIPIMDTLRVIFIRVFILKKSPFNADRNHIHHALLDIGLTHVQSTLILVGVNIAFIVLAFILNHYLRASVLLITLAVLAIGLSQIPFLIKHAKKRNGTISA